MTTAGRIKITGERPDQPSQYRFGRLILDTGRRQLTHGRRTVRLGRLTFDLLQALVEEAPNVVSHDQLAQRVWNGRPVSPETLSQRVKLLRDALCDHADQPRYVEVIRGHGHRLIPPVQPLTARSNSADGWYYPASVTGWVLVGVVTTLFLVNWSGSDGSAAALPGKTVSIAVMPFKDVANNDFGDDIAEEIINELDGTAVGVFPATSSFVFRDNIKELHATDTGLGASHVLKGSVQRAPGSVRVMAQLVECATGLQIWSDFVPRGDQEPENAARQLAASLAAKLEGFLTPTDTAPTRTGRGRRNVVAYAPDERSDAGLVGSAHASR